MRAEHRGWLLRAATALTAIFVMGVVAVRLAPDGSVVAAWWPPAGIAVAFLAASPASRRPGFLVAQAVVISLAALLGGRPPVVAAALGCANAAGAATIVWVLGRRTPGRLRLHTQEDLWRLLFATACGGAVAGGLIGLIFTVWTGAPFWSTATTVLASQGAAVLLIAPLGLDVSGPSVVARRAEPTVQLLATLLVVLLVFGPDQELPVDFLPIPLLMWGAMRLPTRFVTLELLLVGLVASMMTRLGHGPIAHDYVADGLRPETVSALMQAYLVCLALVVLPLAMATRQRLVALREAVAGEERFRRSFSDSLIGMLLLRESETGLVVDEANTVAAELLGTEVPRLLGRPWGSGLSSADRARMREACAAILRGRLSGWVQEVRVAREGTRWVRLAVSPLDRPGGARMLSVQLVDLTAERAAQEDLERERDFSTAVVDTTDTLIVVVDRHGRIVRFNPAAEAVSGLASTEVAGKDVAEVVGPDLGSRLRALVEGRDADEARPGSGHLETEWRVSSDDRRTVRWSCAPLDPDDPGSPLVLTGIDVTDERRAQRLVDQVLAATTGTSIIGTDSSGLISFFNLGAERLLGWTAEEVVGKIRAEAFHDPEEIAAQGFVSAREPVAPTSPTRGDYTYVRKDGSTITVSLTVSPMTGSSGEVVGFLGVAEDVTERRRVEDLLRVALAKERDAVERLNEVDRAKTDFVSTVSHELRTPITSVLGYTQMLQRGSGGGLSERQARLLARVESNGLRLQSLIEDLLTLSRIEGGTFRLQDAPVDLREVVLRSSEATETQREHRDLTWSVEPGATPVVVSGDGDQLDRAVINLLTNAVKFTPDGGSVRVRLTTEGGAALVTVEDSGIGISEGEQSRLWDRFFRSLDAQRRAIPGTGLGLSIVRTIVHGHGGTIGVESRAGSGSTFSIRLPLANGGAVLSAAAGAAGPRSDGSAPPG